MKIQAAKPVWGGRCASVGRKETGFASRMTGILRPVVRCAHDGMLVSLATGFSRSWTQSTPVFGRRRSLLRSARRALFWCSIGAIGVEKMDFVDSMDNFELTPSREKTENTPKNAVYKHHIGFEVRR